MLSIGDPQMLWALWNDMKYKDWFMALLDVESYIAEKERALTAYEDRTAWAKKMLVNIARSGYFSSDRTIAQYDADIWHLRLPRIDFKTKKSRKAVERSAALRLVFSAKT